MIDGRLRYLYRRRFCLTCSPFLAHNTSKHPPRIGSPEQLQEHRRRRRNQKTYRYQKKRRKTIKAALVAQRGGRCQDCGYMGVLAVFEFHHRDASSKEFGIGNFTGALARLLAEAEKCDLLCANCHRLRHALSGLVPVRPEAAVRRDRKARAVAHMGGSCFGCGQRFSDRVFEFHHRDGREKDFGISEDGIARSWEKTVAELGKCVMLCANCHREVHAGVRVVDEGLLGLGEGPGFYAEVA